MRDLKPFRIYTLCSQENNYGFSMWDKFFFSLNILGVIFFCSVRLLLKTNNQTEFKNRTETDSNRPVSVQFSFLEQKPVWLGFFSVEVRFSSVFSISSL
jgi:predicted MFS family arabinose efflux permease